MVNSTDRLPEPEGDPLEVAQRRHTPLSAAGHTMFLDQRRRTGLALGLMVGQTLLYDAVFFTVAITLTTFFKVADQRVG